MRALALLLVVGLGAHARAAPLAKQERVARAHLLTAALMPHLKVETQTNALSLVHYGGKNGDGSGTVVGAWTGRRPGRVRALILTNNHVVDRNHGRKTTTLTFSDGSVTRRSHVIAKSRFLDYALLEVDLPQRIAESAFRPATPTAHIGEAGDKVYALGAATSMVDFKVKDFLDVSHASELQKAVDRGEVYEHPTISLGKLTTGYPEYLRVPDGSRFFSQSADYAITHGASGGPVFSAKTHMLIGINANGARDEHVTYAGITTTSHVLLDLSRKMARGKIAPRFQDTVGSLLDAAPPDSTPAPAVTP